MKKISSNHEKCNITKKPKTSKRKYARDIIQNGIDLEILALDLIEQVKKNKQELHINGLPTNLGHPHCMTEYYCRPYPFEGVNDEKTD